MFDEFENIDEYLQAAGDEALYAFGEKYLTDATRIIATRIILNADQEMLYTAVTLLTAIYLKKLKDNEFKDAGRIH